jgi:hypothetical protein
VASGSIAPRILDVGTDGGEWSASRPGPFTPRERIFSKNPVNVQEWFQGRDYDVFPFKSFHLNTDTRKTYKLIIIEHIYSTNSAFLNSIFVKFVNFCALDIFINFSTRKCHKNSWTGGSAPLSCRGRR